MQINSKITILDKETDKKVSRKARKGHFRVISIDSIDGSDCCHGDRQTVGRAITLAKSRQGDNQKCCIYDDQGKCLWSDSV